MNEIPDLNHRRNSIIGRFASWLFSRRIIRRVLVSLAVVVTLIGIIYARVNWRGDHLLADAKREVAAKGENLDWSAYVPAPVPDDQNIFKAPKMAEWFNVDRSIAYAPLDHPVTNDFARRFENPDTTNEISTAVDANRYLAWSDQFEADFQTIAEALKRPYARTVTDYSQPLSMRFPSLMTYSRVTRTLEQRAKCHLLIGQPEKAWRELAVLHDLGRLVECQGKFITPEGAWLVRQGNNCSLAVIAKGLEMHLWTDAQLFTLEGRLQDTDSIGQFAEALRCGRALLLGSVESGVLLKVRPEPRILGVALLLAPHGTISGRFSQQLRDWQGMIEALGPSNGVIHPQDVNRAFANWKRAQEGLPNLLQDQTWINEGLVACALERYRLAHGGYPETLAVLAPQFLAEPPQDIINGEALKYRRTENGGFILYSIGWNAIDDGGKTFSNPRDHESSRSGDWCWSDVSKQ